MNVSEFIFDYYNKKGIDSVFMITGGQAMYLDDAVASNKNFTVIHHHHEQACSMCADAYGRIKNKPAIALVTAGPGSVNAMNGVVGAYTDSSPMIVISGQSNLSFVQYQEKTNIRQFGVQGINIKPLVQNIVKYFITIDDVNKVKYYLEKAYILATTGRPGPVWIDVPLDIQRSEIPLDTQIPIEKEELFIDHFSVDKTVSLVINKLKASKRPLFLIGQGISLANAREEFLQLLEKVKAPVITSRLGIDLINSDHKYYVGRPGNYGERAANFAVQNSDLIISIGCRLASSLVGHAPSMFGQDAYKIVVDIDQKELDKPGVNIQEKICLDAKIFIQSLLNKLKTATLPTYDVWVARTQMWKEKYPVCLEEYKFETPVNSYYFVEQLSRMASNTANILVDTGSCFHVVCQTWKIKKGQHYLTTGGLSSMGYWCAGIGACIANDRKETIVITGDGSLQMNIQELAPIRHNNLPIKIFVLNNNGYLLIRSTQKNFMNNYIGESPETGVWCPDLKKIAAAYEIPYFRIEKAGDVEMTISEVLKLESPVICEVMTPEWQLLMPRITSEKSSDGKLIAHEYADMFPFLSRDEYKQNMKN